MYILNAYLVPILVIEKMKNGPPTVKKILLYILLFIICSRFPVILSIENHASLDQQVRMANHMKTIFGCILVLFKIINKRLHHNINLLQSHEAPNQPICTLMILVHLLATSISLFLSPTAQFSLISYFLCSSFNPCNSLRYFSYLTFACSKTVHRTFASWNLMPAFTESAQRTYYRQGEFLCFW